LASIGSFYFSSDDLEPVKQRQRSTPRPKVAAAPEPVAMPVETSAPPRTHEATTLATTEVTTSTSPVEAVPEQCKTVAFLRIQKLLDLDDYYR
jgi:hypothetical protein